MTQFKEKTLARYKKEYDRLSVHIKKRQPFWEVIREKLLAHDCQKLKLATSMQEEGQLFGLDEAGKALFKDRGTEPVMYGLDEKGSLIVVYNRHIEMMEKIIEFLEYEPMREEVLKSGYEMFPVAEDLSFSDEIKQVIQETGKAFVASKDQ